MKANLFLCGVVLREVDKLAAVTLLISNQQPSPKACADTFLVYLIISRRSAQLAAVRNRPTQRARGSMINHASTIYFRKDGSAFAQKDI